MITQLNRECIRLYIYIICMSVRDVPRHRYSGSQLLYTHVDCIIWVYTKAAGGGGGVEHV